MNNNYLKRHAENLASANLLIHDHSHYCSSVHCSYYAVFQYLLHFHKVRNTNVFRDRDRLGNVGSHDLIITATFTILERSDTRKAELFKREIMQLKTVRVISDYKEACIDYTISVVAYETAKKLIRTLSETMKN